MAPSVDRADRPLGRRRILLAADAAAPLTAYRGAMTFPILQFQKLTLREERNRQLALEAEATRGRSMWRDRPVKQPRFRLRAARV
jgi:hypothetical protein